MQRFILKFIGLFIIASLCSGCGGGGGGTSAATPAAGVQLAGIDSDFVDGASRNSTTILYVNSGGDTFEQWTSDSNSSYYYDETGTLIQEDIEYHGSSFMDRVSYVYDDNQNLITKRYERVGQEAPDQLYLSVNFAYDDDGYVVSETHVAPYSIDGEGNVIAQDRTLATIAYCYAFKDASRTELILIEKRSVSADGEARIYFSYDAANEKVVRIEYDWENDFNIDTILYVTYDDQGNRLTDEIYDYDFFGEEHLRLTIFYAWESVSTSAALSPVTDRTVAFGVCGGPYY